MRTFIGLDIDNKLKAEIGSLQTFLREHAISGRWKHLGNFHLTLKFLGEINEESIEDLSYKLDETAKNSEKFMLSLSDLGCFPGNKSLRVVWLSLGADTDKLRKLQLAIDDNLEEIGFQKEKRAYVPHITIAQDVIFREEFNVIKKLAADSIYAPIHVERIHLFKSEQIKNKRIYTSIREFKLG